jgi:shikimate kinase
MAKVRKNKVTVYRLLKATKSILEVELRHDSMPELQQSFPAFRELIHIWQRRGHVYQEICFKIGELYKEAPRVPAQVSNQVLLEVWRRLEVVPDIFREVEHSTVLPAGSHLDYIIHRGRRLAGGPW